MVFDTPGRTVCNIGCVNGKCGWFFDWFRGCVGAFGEMGIWCGFCGWIFGKWVVIGVYIWLKVNKRDGMESICELNSEI